MKFQNLFLLSILMVSFVSLASALPLDFNATTIRMTNMNTMTDSYLSDSLCGANIANIAPENCTQYIYYVVNGTYNGALDFNATDDGFGNWINNQTGEFYYQPNAFFNGSDHFYYIISNGTDNTTAALASIGVDNLAPVITNTTQKFNTSDGNLTENVSSNVLDANGDALFFELTQDVRFGQLNFSSDGSFNYTSNKSDGVDFFKYKVTDLHMDSEEVLVLIIIGNNTAPVANMDVYSIANASVVKNDVNVTGNVKDNDSDSEQDILFAYLNSTTQNGTLNFYSDGSFEYYPNINFVGIDSFTYSISDQDKDSSIVNVTIYVNTTIPTDDTIIDEGNNNRGGSGGGSRNTVNTANVTKANWTIPEWKPSNFTGSLSGSNTTEQTQNQSTIGRMTSLFTGAVIGVYAKTSKWIIGIVVLIIVAALVFTIARKKKIKVEPTKFSNKKRK